MVFFNGTIWQYDQLTKGYTPHVKPSTLLSANYFRLVGAAGAWDLLYSQMKGDSRFLSNAATFRDQFMCQVARDASLPGGVLGHGWSLNTWVPDNGYRGDVLVDYCVQPGGQTM